MRLMLCLLVLLCGAAVYAADMQAVGTAEAERIAAEKAAAEEAARAAEAKKAAEAERAAALEAQRQAEEQAQRAAKEAAEREAALEAQKAAEAEQAAREAAAKQAAEAAEKEAAAQAAQQSATPLSANVIPAQPDLSSQCGAPVELRNAQAAQAIAGRAKADAAAHATAPAQLPAAARESVAALASAHALDQGTAGRAYYVALCAELTAAGGSPLSLRPLLALLADTLGVTPPGAGVAAGIAAKPEPAQTAGAASAPQPETPAPVAAPAASQDAAAKAPDAEPAGPEPAKPSIPAAAAAVPNDSAAGQPLSDRKETSLAAKGTVGLLGEAECAALGVPVGCPDLNAVLAQLLEKPLEYNHPKEMLIGRKTAVALILSTDWDGKDLPKELSDELKGLPGEVKQALTKITRIMSAELTGKGFEISPAGSQERAIAPPEPAAWKWQVTPSEIGPDKTLKLRLYAHVQGADAATPPLLIKTMDAAIDVDVAPWDWLVSEARTLEPAYAIAAALIGLIAAILAFIVARRRRAAVAFPEPGGYFDIPNPWEESAREIKSGPVIGDLIQSASDGRPSSAPAPAPAPRLVPALEMAAVEAEPEPIPIGVAGSGEEKGEETAPERWPGGGMEPKKD
jgi:hypothetical protein